MSSQPSYLVQTNNNLARLQAQGGGYCVYCFQYVNPNQVVTFADVSTAICPHCATDAVVPGKPTRSQLQQWHEEGFGDE